MNREEARQYIIERGKDHLTPDRTRKGFIKMRRKTPAFRHGDISRVLFFCHLLH